MREHGPNPPVNLHSLEYLRYYQSCINPQGEKMINMHALKVKFVTTLLTHIRTPTKLLINYNMDYEKIVETAERMQADNGKDPARQITNRGKSFYFKEGRKIRQKTPEERSRLPAFQRSTWKKGDLPRSGGSAPDKPKRVYPPRSTPSRKGPTKPRPRNKVFRQMSEQEKESLKAQGKCLICKESGHYARDCPKKKSISTAYQQVSQRGPWQQRTPFQGSRPWPNTAALEIMKPPHDDIKYLIPQTAKISCAAMVQINGQNAQVRIDPCTMHGNLISNQLCDMYKIPTEKTD